MDAYIYKRYNIRVRWRRKLFIEPLPLFQKKQRKEGAAMPEEKKSRYTEAQAKAAKKYLKESVEDIRIRVPKGQKAVIKDHAEGQGESMNAFVVRAISETMVRDNEKPGPSSR